MREGWYLACLFRYPQCESDRRQSVRVCTLWAAPCERERGESAYALSGRVGENPQAEQKVMLAEAKALRTQSLSPSKAKGGSGGAPKAAPACRLEGKGKREEERRMVHRRAAAQRPPKVTGSMTAFFQAAAEKVRA